jgi:ribonuclease P protein component
LQFWRYLLVARVRVYDFSATPPVLPFEEVCVEAHLSAKQSAARQEARLSRPHEHQGRPGRSQVSAGQGPAPSVGLIGRFRGRSSFERLAQTGSRARAGVLWCTFVLDPHAMPPQVAYAIGRAVGPAVTRNLLRRRLRSLLHQNYPDLPAGLYLLGASPAAAQRSFNELAFDLTKLMSRVVATQATPPTPTN